VETQLNVAESKLKKFKSQDLQNHMKDYIEKQRSSVQKLKWNIRFGSDYVIAVEPIHSSPSTNSELKSEQISKSPAELSDTLPNNYSSPVQEQPHLFPIDEDSDSDS